MNYKHTDLYHYAPEIARHLNEAGFKPIPACEVQPGMVVIYFETDVFGLEARGPALSALVRKVSVDKFGGIVIKHTAGETEADEMDEVWVSRTPKARPNWLALRHKTGPKEEK